MTRQTATQQRSLTSSPLSTGGLLQRKCGACGQHTIAGGTCAECGKKKSGLQRKLTIGASNDPLEQEADRIADQVLAAPAPTAVNAAPPRIQRYTGQSAEGMDTAPASVDGVLSSPGSPLETSLQQDMEQRFGHDFSRVRVHTDGSAGRSAREVNANAYTVENNIVFGAGRYAPRTHEGRRLIAHELTHTVQQKSGQARPMIQRQERSWIDQRIEWVRTATRKENWADADPPGAYYVLNGLSMDDMVRVLRALTQTDRKKLSENLDEQAAGFDRSRLHLALALAATPSADNEFRERSENLHYAIRIGNYSNSPNGAYFQLAAVDSTQRRRLLNALSPSTRQLLFVHLNEASLVPGGDEVISTFGKPEYSVAASVTATTVKEPTYGHCREFTWVIRWGTQPTLKNGYIVQEIRRINTDFSSSARSMPNTDETFWEAWRVDEQGNIGDGGEDIWGNGKQPWTKGKWEIIGRAFAISGTLDPKAKFRNNSGIQGAGFGNSTKIRPENLGPPSLIRSMNGEWDCTDDNAKPDGFRYHRAFKS